MGSWCRTDANSIHPRSFLVLVFREPVAQTEDMANLVDQRLNLVVLALIIEHLWIDDKLLFVPTREEGAG